MLVQAATGIDYGFVVEPRAAEFMAASLLVHSKGSITYVQPFSQLKNTISHVRG